GGGEGGRAKRSNLQRVVCGLIVEGEFERQLCFALLPRGGLVGDFDGELQHVVFAQEPRRVGLHHEVFGRNSFVFQKAGAKLLVVREAEEAPLGQCLGHRELEFYHAVAVGKQLREEKRRFVEIFAGGDLV